MKIAILYHYFHPDDVISARLFSELALHLRGRGWEVESWPCNRSCRDEHISYPPRENWEGVDIRRVWRPPLRQASILGRIVNALWMVRAWERVVRRPEPEIPDVVLLGTDPSLAPLVVPKLRRLRPQLKIALWCHDLYPDAFFAAGIFRFSGLIGRNLRRRLSAGFRECDLVAALGPCMRRRLDALGVERRWVEITPWALHEPENAPAPDPEIRRALFGEARLGLLYSGNFGRAHEHAGILELARALRGEPISFSFAIRGNRAEELRRAVRADDTNVRFAPFAAEEALTSHLAAADIHLVSLRPEWTGVVVPSKFFGALAVGRPVLFAGSRGACLADWIDRHKIGWVLDKPSALVPLADELRALSATPEKLADIKRRCHEVYQANFSRRLMLDRWFEELTR